LSYDVTGQIFNVCLVTVCTVRLARNHSGLWNQENIGEIKKKSQCWHCKMPKKHRTRCCRWFTI